ncbi:MAG: carboxypeptidase [Thermobacillus sp. ZCTH02-B1]|nr:MAG: carboxypeptidase [Thermobacillus sp. ZCTH02-B1]
MTDRSNAGTPEEREKRKRKWLRAERRMVRLGRLRMTAAALAFLLLLVVFGLMAGRIWLGAQTLPAARISQTSYIYDSRGGVIAALHAGGHRRPVELQEISPYLVQATLAIEDRRFFEHHGIDLRGLARAALVNLRSLSAKQGASTLTQQLARNLWLSHERTWKRKLQEAVYAAMLEMKYDKTEILTMYLNQIYYGHGAYGIEAAAERYFGKRAKDLTLAESAMLAGIPKGPRYYSPYRDMKNAKDRQRLVLNAMVEQGVITREEADAAFREVLPFRPPKSDAGEGYAPYFRDYVRSVVVDRLGFDERLLAEGGLRVYTTLDPDIQKAAEEAVKRGIPAGSEQQAALVAIDPRNGHIKAMVGGRDYAENQYNRVLAKTRQPGSSFKPFLYLTALEQGMTPVTRFRSEPTVFTYDDGRRTYEPRNHNDHYFMDEIDMRTAIASSDNIYAVHTIMAVGPENVIATARRFGIDSPMQPVPSLALGAFPVSPLEMASAFGALAAGGVRHEPVAVLRIEDHAGRVLYEAQPPSERVASPAHAYVLTRLLESVFEPGGTAYRVSSAIRRPVAGKTGTTAYDAWLVGYTPELAAAVWVGYDRARAITRAEAHRAAPIFADFIERALAGVPPKMFPEPEGVVTVYIDPGTGKLASGACPLRRAETFVLGTEPAEVCDAHDEAPEEEPAPVRADHEIRRSWWEDLMRWWTG